MSYLEEMAARLGTPEFEGTVPWMYQDTAGRVTVGIGLMLPNPDRACQLPFHPAADPQAADELHIRADYARVRAMAPGMPARRYETLTSLVLPPTAIQVLCVGHLKQNEVELRAMWPAYDGFPVAAKLGLLDMAYNLGMAKLRDEYLHFGASVAREDWSAAAGECHRRGPSEARNEWTRQQFMAAARTSMGTGTA